MPSLGLSLFLIAAGAILAFAVDYTITGIDIQIVGAILVIVGCVGAALSLLLWTSFSPFARTRSTDVIVDARRNLP